jgi:hypothetical protein
VCGRCSVGGVCWWVGCGGVVCVWGCGGVVGGGGWSGSLPVLEHSICATLDTYKFNIHYNLANAKMSNLRGLGNRNNIFS